jgi:hypothetical protein
MARKLTPEVQAFVVRSLACHDTPTIVARELLRAHGISMKLPDILRYDPTSSAAAQRGLAKKWRDLFHATREAHVQEMVRVETAHRATRLRMLERGARKFEEREAYRPMADMLERIAKECGDAYTNRRELTGKDGGPIQVRPVLNLDSLTLEELERFEAVALAAKAQGRKTITIPFTPVES